MNSSLMKFFSKVLICSMLWLTISQANAAMVGTEQVVAQAQSQFNRDALLNLVSRADVAQQLQTMGISPENATARVNALTNEEVQQVAGKLESLPAGASSGWAWAAGLLIVAILIWLVYYKK
jgi:predicted Zn-dependent peptidase